MYIESGKVKFYPSAYRQYQDGTETKNINPESELNTEYNITSHIAKLLKKNKGSFIVDYVENVKLEFYLGGYYIHITSPQDILDAFPNATQIWANMKVTPFTPTDTTKGFSELYEVVDYDDIGKNIDELNNNIVSFKGVAFLSTKDNNATFSLQLFSREDTDSPWDIYDPSNYVLDSSEIGNTNDATGDNISQRFDTVTLYADNLHATNGHIVDTLITNALDVKGGALFENLVTLNNNLVPATNNNLNIGSNDKEFASIYVDKIIGVSEIGNGQNNITLMSSVVPSGTVNIGSTTSKLATIYTTSLNVNEITLNSNITPNGTVDLGSTSSMFNHIYTDTLTSNGIETLGLKVTDINSTSSFISLYKNILPTSTGTISLGNSNLKFGGIYATTFYGALSGNVTGNASTATKLNGTDAGGTKNPVYFDNGVPTASSYNSTLYDRIERESTFQNVLSATTSNTKSFIVSLSVSQTSTIHLNMFAMIFRPSSYAEFNGGMCTMNFIVHSTASSSIIYSNHIYAYKSILYRLKITRSNVTAGLVRFTCVLQYINKSSATDSDEGWADVDGEYVQDVTVHYTYR